MGWSTFLKNIVIYDPFLRNITIFTIKYQSCHVTKLCLQSMACQCVVVVAKYCEWNDLCDLLITWCCVVCCLFVIRINANVNESYECQTCCACLCECVEVIFCLPQLATTGLQYRESGSPIVQQISRYGDTPKYAYMVDRDIGNIYQHMSIPDDRVWSVTGQLADKPTHSHGLVNSPKCSI